MEKQKRTLDQLLWKYPLLNAAVWILMIAAIVVIIWSMQFVPYTPEDLEVAYRKIWYKTPINEH